jgi:hypothetical protein
MILCKSPVVIQCSQGGLYTVVVVVVVAVVVRCSSAISSN